MTSPASDPPTPARPEPRPRALRRFSRLLRTELGWIGRHVRGLHAALGIFLAAGFGLSVAALLLFAAIAQVVARGATHRADLAILHWLHARPSPWLDGLAVAGTALGSGAAMWLVLLLGTIFLWGSGHRWSMLLLWIALLGGRFLNRMSKGLFDRPRPRLFGDEIVLFGRTFAYPESTSFPSGHATTAMVVFGTLAYLVARLEHTRRMQGATLAAAAVIVLVIGFARVYLGVHYPSDVVAGYLAGFVWASSCALGVEVLRYFRFRRPQIVREEEDLSTGLPIMNPRVSPPDRANGAADPHRAGAGDRR